MRFRGSGEVLALNCLSLGKNPSRRGLRSSEGSQLIKFQATKKIKGEK